MNGDPAIVDPVDQRPGPLRPALPLPAITGGRLPGISPEGFSSSSTDIQNVRVASAMEAADQRNRTVGFGTVPSSLPPTTDELVNQAIDRRRSMIVQGIDPDAPARYISSQRPRSGGPSRSDELQSELHGLTQLRQQSAMFNAKQQHEQFLQNKDIMTAQSGGELLGRLTALENQFPSGTKEHEQAVGQMLADPSNVRFIAAMKANPAVAAQVKAHMEVHDATAKTVEALKQYLPQGYQPESIQVPTEKGGHVVFKRQGDVPTTARDRFAKVVGNISENQDSIISLQAEVADHQKRAAEEQQANIEKGSKDVKYSGTQDWIKANRELSKIQAELKGNLAESEQLKSTFPSLGVSTAQATPKNDSGIATASAMALPATQFDTEDAARTAGHKTGDVVTLKNPATGKYQKARLD